MDFWPPMSHTLSLNPSCSSDLMLKPCRQGIGRIVCADCALRRSQVYGWLGLRKAYPALVMPYGVTCDMLVCCINWHHEHVQPFVLHTIIATGVWHLLQQLAFAHTYLCCSCQCPMHHLDIPQAEGVEVHVTIINQSSTMPVLHLIAC